MKTILSLFSVIIIFSFIFDSTSSVADKNADITGLAGENIRGVEGLDKVPQRPWERPDQRVGSVVRRVRPEFSKSLFSSDEGALAGKSIYVSPGHGWYWTGTRWTTQRGLSEGVVEDLSNAETVNQFLVPCLWRSGAYVVPVREIDLTDFMVVVDNDDMEANPDRGTYIETGDSGLFSNSSLQSFGWVEPPLSDGTNPFEEGTNRLMDTSAQETARAVYTFNVPVSSYYNVYISYTSYSERAPDAHYIVNHPGGQTHFRVDQRHHGATWVLLGRFWFKKGVNSSIGSIAVANDSEYSSSNAQVSLDAVRIGGGRGLWDRGGGTSQKPRYEECCRYHAQFSGAPSTVWNSSSEDNNDDVSCRSRLAAWIHETGEDSVYFSWHTNAGGGRGTSTYVYSSNPPDGTYTPGMGTAGSDEFAALVQSQMVSAFNVHYENPWYDRGVRSAYFGEINPSYHDSDVPAALVEALFHDSAQDMIYYRRAPERYIAGRAACHAIIKYFAQRDGYQAVLPPEPVNGVSVFNSESGVRISWNPPLEDPVGGSAPEGYRVYISPVERDWGEGVFTSETSMDLTGLVSGQVLYIRVSSVNSGGESIISPPVAVGVSPTGSANILIIDAFTALGEALNIKQDLGYTSLVHRMLLREMYDFRDGFTSHARALGRNDLVFDTISLEKYISGEVDLTRYELIDVVNGRGQNEFPDYLWDDLSTYVATGGNLFISGSNLLEDFYVSGRNDLLAFIGAESYTVDTTDFSIGMSGAGIFAGISGSTLNDGESEGYYPGDMNVITPLPDGSTVVTFSSGTTAGLLYEVNESGGVLTLGFPFENIIEEDIQSDIMEAVTDYFGVYPPLIPDAGTDTEDTGTDADDAGNDSDSCEENYDCKTETVIGCHCKNVPGTKTPVGHELSLVVIFAVGLFLIRKRQSFLN
ncbi:MAG: fibronectin type III domain-containing protein [Deltaproteobacteria bacterium]|nr:fibronectin type III domain-containing protein [Deltaproteobacteria bacterium]